MSQIVLIEDDTMIRRVLSIRNNQTGKDNVICIGQARINTDEAKVYVYSIPWGILVAGMAALIAAVMLITYVEMNKLKDKSIIDEIRMDVM